MLKVISQFRAVFNDNEPLDLNQWRERSFLFVLSAILLISLPALVLSSFKAVDDGLYFNLAGYIIAYSFCIYLVFSKALSFPVRAWIAVAAFTILGVQSIFSIGPVGSGRIWFFSTAVFTTFCLGVRAGLILVFFQIGFLFLSGYLIKVGLVTLKIPQDFSYDIWIITTITFSFLCLISVIAMGRLIGGMALALDQSRQTSEQLRVSTEQLHERIDAHNESLESLKESEMRWHFALESAGDGVWDWNTVDDVISYSPSFAVMLGYKPIEVAGGLEERLAYIHPEDRERMRQIIEELEEGKSSSYAERYRLECKNKSYKWVFDRGKVMSWDKAGRPMRIIGLYTDITKLKNIEQEKVELQTRLSQAQKMESLGTLAGGVAHDFNNILSAIVGYTELAIEDLPTGSLSQKELEEVMKASQRATELVQQILVFSRKGSLEKKAIDIQRIVNEAVKMMRSSFPSTIAIKESYSDKRGLVYADPTSIHQVVVNLCTNAHQAMQNRKGLLRVETKTVEIDAEQVFGEWIVDEGVYTVLMIIDNGPGMEEQVIKHIFEPYFTTKPKGEGTGLGLATVHGIVKECGGFINVESTPGEGTVFSIYLPNLERDDEQIIFVAQADKSKNEEKITGNEHILLIDDEAKLCSVGKAQLERRGYKVTAMTSSKDALELYLENPKSFDLVISDQTMPDLTGVDLAEKMLQIRPDLPFILYTGFTSTVSKEEALDMGIKAFLEKPLSAARLSEEVRAALDPQIH